MFRNIKYFRKFMDVTYRRQDGTIVRTVDRFADRQHWSVVGLHDFAHNMMFVALQDYGRGFCHLACGATSGHQAALRHVPPGEFNLIALEKMSCFCRKGGDR